MLKDSTAGTEQKEINMASEQDNRVLSRRGARVITTEEAGTVKGGGPQTETVCTFQPGYGADGDTFLGEC
jgi:hypothetical protein